VELNELEFFHTQILLGQDTAEVAALMKNDRISVRRERSTERLEEEVWNRLQRELDQPYFRQLRDMLPNAQDATTPIYEFADVVLDCKRVLYPNTIPTIKCHSVMICKRCPWLNRMISAARQECARRSVVNLPDVKTIDVDEERRFELMQQIKVEPRQEDTTAAQIENDDEDLNEAWRPSDRALRRIDRRTSGGYDDDIASLGSPTSQSHSSSKLLWIEIKDHPPEAMKILLEYCYTNRVENLGFEAFMHSCRTKPQYKKMQGPVPPFSLRRWPNSGEPTIMFDVALAGIRLAEEANLPRLSLMCEIAAAQLVDHTHAVDALTACELQRQTTGNQLPRLRKATMEIVLVSYQLGNDNITTAFLKNALADKSTLLIPTLISGTVDAVEAGEKRMRHLNVSTISTPEKRDWQTISRRYFDKIDKIDAIERDRERRKRRIGDDYKDDYMEPIDDQYIRDGTSSTILDDDELFAFWGDSGIRHLSLKRMNGHQITGVVSSLYDNRSASRRSPATNSHLTMTSKRNIPGYRRDLR
jgi:hypothetical protein